MVAWLQKILKSAPVGKPWIPSNPASLFDRELKELRYIYFNLSGKVARETVTKKKLRGDLLRSSGMYPAAFPKRHWLFVSHSFLVALARGVIWSMSSETEEPDAQKLFGDGFIAWIVQTTGGQNWSR